MMRRSRISVRPNIARPGGRGLPGSQEGQHGQGAAAVDTTHAAGTEGKGPDSAAVIDPGQPVEQSAETAAGLNTAQDTLPEKIIPPDLGEEDQNGETPNDRPLMSTTPQRRKRFSAMPNLSKPRATPAPRTPKSPLPAAPSQPPASKPAAPPTPAEPPDPVPEDQAAESSGTKQGVGSPGVGSPGVGSPGVESPGLAVLGDQVTSQDQTGPVSPVAPTTSCSEPPSEKNKKRTRKSSGRQSVSPESKASSSQPVQSEPVPSYGKLSPGNTSPQEGPSMQHYPLKLVGPLEDRRRIAKARKLKEMMRLENRKEKSQRKSKPHEDDFSSPLDHSKMTMRDLIYYLPDTNPMKSAVMEEQKQDEQFAPPFPSQELPPTKPEVEEEEDEEDDDGAMKDEDLLVPKVKVAEDGSLVIDEESLTVRVTRAQGPSIVEGNDPVFERGSTTTYTSFRNLKYTKPWSDKETDMFYLALSMVGLDFSMMCHLFPHRDRKEVKNKFKREEKTNSWRIDKAFREKRPFDMEFFSSLLELVLAADKRKRDKSKPKGSSGEKPKRKRKRKKASVKGGSEGQVAKDGELDCDVAEGNLETAEKENEDCSNVAKAEDSKKGTRKTRKRVKKNEGEEQEEEKPDSTENQEEEVKPKRRKKMANGKKASVKGASEGQATGDGKLDADVAEGDMETAEKENEDCSKDSAKGTRKKRKRVKKSEEEEQAEEDPDSAEEQEVKVKKKRQKKMANGKKASLKGTDEDQLSPDVEVGDGVAEGDLEASEEKNEDSSNVTDATNTATATRKKCKRAKKGEEEEEQEEEEPDSTKEKADGRKKKQSKKNPDDGAILVNVTENEVASVQSDAEEAVGSETMGSTVEGQLDEPVRVTSAEAEPSLVRGRSTENIPDSEEKTLDSSRREEEECRADDVSLFEISDCSALLESVFAIDGSTLPLTDEESPVGDQQGAPGVSPTDGQKLINNSRVEGQESPPSSLPPPEATSPKGRGQLPETELWPRVGTHQESHPSSKLNMGERSEEEDHDEGGWEDTEVEEEEEEEKEVQDQVQVEEQGSPCHTEILSQEQVLVPLGLHSLELLSNELQIPAGVSDAPGPGVSADAQRSVPGCERAEDECVELSEHHLNLLVDVIESLSPHLVGGMQAEDDDEVARTLLTLSNPDLQFPTETANALDPPHSAPVEEQEPESEQAGQSQSSGQAPQSVTSDLPVTSAPVDEEEMCPVEEPVTSEEGESIATAVNVMPNSESLRSDSLVQSSAPLGRRSRFPKPRPNLGLATRAPRTPLRGTTAPPCPGPVTCAAPPTADTESPKPTEEERSDRNRVANKEGSSVQNEGEASGSEKLLEPGALSTQSETLCSDSLVQSVPLVRRSRFPKPRPNLGRSTRAPHTAPSQNPATPKPVVDSSSTPLEESSTLTPVQESPTCSSSDLSAEVIDQKTLTEGSSETQNTEEESPTVETGAASSSFIAPLGPSQPCPGPSFTDPVPGTGGEETAEGAPASTGVPENELVLADEDASSSADESRQAAGIEAPGVRFDGDANAFITKECMEGLSWADGGEEEPTFILTLFAVPPPEVGDYQTGPEALGLAAENPFSPPTSMIADPQSGTLPAISEPHCESQSVETAEAGSGCGSVTHLVLSDALIPACEEQEEGPAQHWTGLQEQRPHTAPSQTAGETSLTAVMNNDAEGLPELCEEGHSSQTVDPMTESHDPVAESHDPVIKSHDSGVESRDLVAESHDPVAESHDPVAESHDPVAESHDPVAESHDPVAESHDPVEAGTDRTTARDTPSIEKRKPSVRTRRGKLQVKPCVTQRKLRGSVRDEQGLFPEEAVQPGPSHIQSGPAHTQPGPSHTKPGPTHTSLHTHPPIMPHSLQEEPAATSELPGVGELLQGIVGHSNLPQEERGVADSTENKESISGGVEPLLGCQSTQDSCESLSVETAEAGSGCGSVTHLVLSDAFIPVCEEQEEGPAQHWTALQEQRPHTAPSQPAGEMSLTAVMNNDAEGLPELCEEDHSSQIVDPMAKSHDPAAESYDPVPESHDPVAASHDPVVESHDAVEAGTDGTTARDTPCRENKKPPVRTRRGKLQVKPRVTQRKLRGSVRDEQGLLPEEAVQPGPSHTPPGPAHTESGSSHTQPDPAHTSPQTHPPITPHTGAQQEEPAAASELPAAVELPQGIMGHSDLPQEEGGVAVVAEDKECSGGGEEPLLGSQSTQNSCESLSVETAEAGSGCGSVTHLVLSDALIPVCEEQEEGPAQNWTGLQEQHPHTAFSQTAGETSLTAVMKNDAEGLAESYEEDHGSQIVDSVAESHDPVAESHDPVEVGTNGTSEKDIPAQEKKKPPVRTRRGKLQVKPCVTQRKLRSSVRDEQGLLPEEAVQPGPSHTPPDPAHTESGSSHTPPGPSHTEPGPTHTQTGPSHTQPSPAHTSPQTHPPTEPHTDAQQEEPAAASELSAAVELPQGIVGHSELLQEERGVAVVAEHMESSDGEEEPLFSCHNTQDSCESLSVETAEAGSGCGSVTHLVLSDALIPVCEEQEEGPAQNWTGLQEQRPHTASSQTAGETSLTAVMKNDAEGLAESYEEDHGSQIVDSVAESHDPVAESHDPVEVGTNGTSEKDIPAQEKKKPPVRTRRGKLQVKPCVTQRKLRSSVRDEQGLLPEEAVQPGPSHTPPGPAHTESGSSHTQPGPSHTEPGPTHTQTGPSHTQPGPAHTSPQTHPPTEPHTDAQQEEPAAASELSAAVELPQGIVGHSDLLQEERGVAVVAEHMESSDGEEEPLFSCHNTQDSCESLSGETAEAGSGCGSVTHLVLSDALIPVCEEQEEGPAQHWTGLQEQRPHTAPSQTAGETSLTAVMNNDAEGLAELCEEDHSSQTVDPAVESLDPVAESHDQMVESHDPVEAGRDGTGERDTPSPQKRKPPVRTRRGKLQVKPCVTQRKLRRSVRDEQRLFPEEAVQPGPSHTQTGPSHTQPFPAHTSPQSHPPTEPHTDAQQEEPAAASELSAAVELLQGIVGHSDLLQEERGVAVVAEHMESSDGREEPLFSCHKTQDSCESLSVETAEAGSGCGSVTHLVLSDALIPVCEEQEEGPAQHWTGLQEQRPHTAPSQTAGETSLTAVMNNDAEGLPELCEEDHSSQIVDPVAESHDPVAKSHEPVVESPDPVAESHDPVEAGTGGTSEGDTPSQEKRKPPVRTRRGKLQVKPYVTQRKLRGSVRDEQGLFPEEAVQPGPSHTQPGPSHTQPGLTHTSLQIHQPTVTQPDTEQEEPAVGSELLGLEELPQGIVGHSDLPQEEVGLLAGAEDEESISGGVEPLLGCQSTQDSCEPLSVETAEAGSGCGSVTHLVLSDAFIPVCEEQEEGPAQNWTGLQEQRPHTAPSQPAGETSLTAVMNNDAEDLAELCEEDHSSQTVDPAVESHDTAVESHDPVEAGTDGTSERDTPSQEKRKPPVRTRRGKLQVKPYVTQRKLRSSVRDEQGLHPEEAEKPGPAHTQTGPSHTQPDPAHTSPQTLPPTLPLPDTQQEDFAAALELPAAVELPQGTVGHSDLPQQEEGVAAGAEDEKSSDGEEGHSTTQSTSVTLTRSGRAPRGFLSFLSGGSEGGPASRPIRHVSQKPSVNTSRTGRRRTTTDAVTEASAHNSPSSLSPTKVRESTSFSGPSPEPTNSQVSVPAEGEFLCARPSATEEEPTKVSEFYFQDIFTEVLESD